MGRHKILLVSTLYRNLHTFFMPLTVRTTSSVSPEKAIGATR